MMKVLAENRDFLNFPLDPSPGSGFILISEPVLEIQLIKEKGIC